MIERLKLINSTQAKRCSALLHPEVIVILFECRRQMRNIFLKINGLHDVSHFSTSIINPSNELVTFILQEALNIFKTQTFDTVLVFFLVCLGGSATILIFIYGPIHLNTINHLHNTEALIINSFSLGLLITLIPVFGLISVRLGRAKTIMPGIIALTLFSMPYFNLLSTGTFYQVLLGHMIIAIPCANLFSVTSVLITERFPLSVRCSITNFIYSLAACFGGGVTPLIALKLREYGNAMPGMILVALGFISLSLLGYSIRKNTRWEKSLMLVK